MFLDPRGNQTWALSDSAEFSALTIRPRHKQCLCLELTVVFRQTMASSKPVESTHGELCLYKIAMLLLHFDLAYVGIQKLPLVEIELRTFNSEYLLLLLVQGGEPIEINKYQMKSGID